jgi:hypothetical protein
MDSNFLERLLYRSESETLDFKVAQYPFDQATDEQKSELLKDLLAFANAWRESDAYILLGVREVKGGRSIVRGIADHLLNRNLQQFVHSKTNRPISFSYSIERLDGLEIGLISIPLQDRPFFLRKDYGKLKANIVYIRRADTTSEADPDEVYRMGLSSVPSAGQPALELDLFGPSRLKLGPEIDLESISVELPPKNRIPVYGSGSLLTDPPLCNRGYYREFAQWIRDTTFLCPVGIAVTNRSTTYADNVIVTIQCAAGTLTVLDELSLPDKPDKILMRTAFNSSKTRECSIAVEKLVSTYEIRASIGTVQPGTTSWSADVFYMGSRTDSAVEALATISANNLAVPNAAALMFKIKTRSEDLKPNDILLADEL